MRAPGKGLWPTQQRGPHPQKLSGEIHGTPVDRPGPKPCRSMPKRFPPTIYTTPLLIFYTFRFDIPSPGSLMSKVSMLWYFLRSDRFSSLGVTMITLTQFTTMEPYFGVAVYESWTKVFVRGSLKYCAAGSLLQVCKGLN